MTLIDARRVERAVLRVGDAGRLALRGREYGFQDLVGCDRQSDAGARRVQAVLVDRRDRRQLEAEFLRQILELRAAGQRVVGLVRDVGDTVGGLAQLQLGRELRLCLLEALRLARLDLDDAQDMLAERGLDRRARLVQRQLERDVAEFVRDFLAVQQPEFDRLRGPCPISVATSRNSLPAASAASASFAFSSVGARICWIWRCSGIWNSSLRSSYSRCSVSSGISASGFRSLGDRLASVKPRYSGARNRSGCCLVELRQLGLARLGDVGDRGHRER